MAPYGSSGTPLRRVSQGSLYSLARSQEGYNDGTDGSGGNDYLNYGGGIGTGLGFLEPALSEIADEVEALHQNTLALNNLSDKLSLFNENFSSYILALKINAFCVEWPEAPGPISFLRTSSLPQPQQSQHQLSSSTSSNPHQQHDISNANLQQNNPADATYVTQFSIGMDNDPLTPPPTKRTPTTTTAATRGGRGVAKGGIPTRGGRGASSSMRGGRPGAAVSTARAAPASTVVKAAGGVAGKKKRDAMITSMIDQLPLEFRGEQPVLSTAMHKVIDALLLNPDGLKIADMVHAPDLPQPRINKCLIALVGRKMVSKVNAGGVTVYQLSN